MRTTHLGGHYLLTEWLIDRCKNITLSQTSFANGNKLKDTLTSDGV